MPKGCQRSDFRMCYVRPYDVRIGCRTSDGRHKPSPNTALIRATKSPSDVRHACPKDVRGLLKNLRNLLPLCAYTPFPPLFFSSYFFLDFGSVDMLFIFTFSDDFNQVDQSGIEFRSSWMVGGSVTTVPWRTYTYKWYFILDDWHDGKAPQFLFKDLNSIPVDLITIKNHEKWIFHDWGITDLQRTSNWRPLDVLCGFQMGTQ